MGDGNLRSVELMGKANLRSMVRDVIRNDVGPDPKDIAIKVLESI